MNIVKGVAYVAATTLTLGVVATGVVVLGGMLFIHLNSRTWSKT